MNSRSQVLLLRASSQRGAERESVRKRSEDRREAGNGHSRRKRSQKDHCFHLCIQQALLIKERSEVSTASFEDARRDGDANEDNTGFSEGLQDSWSSRASGDQRTTSIKRGHFSMLDFECRAQFLSFFIVATAGQKSYIVLEQVEHAYQHFGGGHSGAGHQRKRNTYIHWPWMAGMCRLPELRVKTNGGIHKYF